MKAAFFTGLERLEIRDVPEPRLEDPREVLLRVDAVGICGSDVHYYRHGRIGDQRLEYPASVGHECAGTVVESGAEVEGLPAGTRVAVDPAFACGACDQCREGRANTCRRLRFMGCPRQAPGAIREHVAVPASACVPLPASLSLVQGAMIEPLSIALHSWRLAAAAPGARVAVLGCGPIGLATLLAARASGAGRCYATDPIDARLRRARRCGAVWTGDPRASDVVAAIREREPEGVDVVFECAGSPACLRQAVDLLAPGGTLVVTGIPETDAVPLDVHRARRKELTLRNVRRQNGCVAPAVRLVADGRVDLDPLVTHHLPLDATGAAFELVAGYRDGVVKAVVHVSDARSG